MSPKRDELSVPSLLRKERGDDLFVPIGGLL